MQVGDGGVVRSRRVGRREGGEERREGVPCAMAGMVMVRGKTHFPHAPLKVLCAPGPPRTWPVCSTYVTS